jgi:hypothetical protein
MVMASGNCVATINPAPLKSVPGENATPWRASLYQLYWERPRRGAPAAQLSDIFVSIDFLLHATPWQPLIEAVGYLSHLLDKVT